MFPIHGQHTISKMKLTSSASDQNVYFTYVGLINEVNPSFSRNEHGINSTDHGQRGHRPFRASDVDVDDQDKDLPIQVERSKALHELVESNRHKYGSEQGKQSSSNPNKYDDSDISDSEELDDYVNPKRLKLTKMNWLTEGREGSVDSSSISLSPDHSSSTLSSRESEDVINQRMSFGAKCLSTILKLDREHNMFGLSNIAIVGKKTSKKIRKEDDKPAFPQTAIIQICCDRRCCKNKSNTDLPASLKCGRCRSCCIDPYCPICVSNCGPPCDDPPCPATFYQCARGKCRCKACQPSKCRIDYTNSYGMKISFKRKPTFEPSPFELTPRSSCILQKPMSARSCHHLPQCIPPSSCFPYLMPCYWPCREGAPCNNPTQCFHNPPCRGPRRRKTCVPVQEICPRGGKRVEEPEKCTNQTCPGRDRRSRAISLETVYEKKKRKERNKKLSLCECESPNCSNCFVTRPKKTIKVQSEDLLLQRR